MFSADVGNALQHLFTVPRGAFCFNKLKNLHFQETHVVTSDIKLVVSNLFWLRANSGKTQMFMISILKFNVEISLVNPLGWEELCGVLPLR